jgi:hypothetical protein
LTAKKRFLLRLEPELYRRLEKWAADELRSVNAQMEYLLRDSLLRAGRLGSGTTRFEPPVGRDEDY